MESGVGTHSASANPMMDGVTRTFVFGKDGDDGSEDSWSEVPNPGIGRGKCAPLERSTSTSSCLLLAQMCCVLALELSFGPVPTDINFLSASAGEFHGVCTPSSYPRREL